MKEITLQTAVQLAINDLLAAGSFSAHDVTELIRDKVDEEYDIKDADYDYDNDSVDGYTVISHYDVRDIVVELFGNGLFSATKSYDSCNGNSYIVYTSKNSKPIQGSTQPSVNSDPILDTITTYLNANGPKTIKQIQSRLKIPGLLCEDIAKLLDLDCALTLDQSISKCLIQ